MRKTPAQKIDLSHTLKSITSFISSNPAYIICASFYILWGVVLLGGTLKSLFTCLFIYAVSLCVALSPLGEQILRFTENIRPLLTKREKEIILPAFEEVYGQAKKDNPDIKVEMCVVDSMSINACAIGSHTVAVTKGAVDILKEDGIKPLIGHEMGHITNGDTKATLLYIVGNGIFSASILLVKAIIILIDILTVSFDDSKIAVFIFSLLKLLFQIYLLVISLLINFFIALNSRSNEYRADEYAHELGYGHDLVETLYLLETISLSDNRSLLERIQASHPIIPRRIANIEKMLDSDVNI